MSQTQIINEFEEKVQNLFSIYKENKINESLEQDDDVEDQVLFEEQFSSKFGNDQEEKNIQKIILESCVEAKTHKKEAKSTTSIIVDDELSPPKQKKEKIDEMDENKEKKDSYSGESNSKMSDFSRVNENMMNPKEQRVEKTDTPKSSEVSMEIIESINQINVCEKESKYNQQSQIETSFTSSDDEDFIEVAMDEQKTLEKEKEVIAYDVEVMNKEDKTQKEININEINEQLNIETEYLLKEKQKETKLSNNVDSYLVEDAKYLCQLFGIPYIIAPGEAEAQCAYLDLTNQTNGSITEDSDIWLFGANNVYRSFFKQNTFIESYSSQLIKTQLGIDRDTLICIAMLVGSDYTLGIENVGIVKAMEILQEFDGESIEKLWNFK
jgi:hypothetical protein